jgi:Thiamine pyrophosphate enzyme, N-terminal TPP binding domain
MSRTAAEFLVKALEKTGVRRVYGVVGDSLNGFTDVMRRRKSIDWIHMRHEEAAPSRQAPKLISPGRWLSVPGAAMERVRGSRIGSVSSEGKDRISR